MTLPRQTLAHTAAALLALGGCEQHSAAPLAPQGAARDPLSAAAPALAPGSAPRSHPAASSPAQPAPEAPPAPAPVLAGDPRDPALALTQWAAAVERRDWAAVRGLWGHGGADSGLSASAFAARWNHLHHPRVTIGAGTQEGAAGSLYYSAPVTIADGPRRVAGTITIRRANDVPGATPEQLRWHADSATRAPWTSLR